jgi:hypothetical protein
VLWCCHGTVTARNYRMRFFLMQTLRRRLPPIVAAGDLFDPVQFKSSAYSAYTSSIFVAGFGLYTVNECTYMIPLSGEIQHLDTLPLIVLPSSTPARIHKVSRVTFPPTSLPSLMQARESAAYLSCGFIADRIGARIPLDTPHTPHTLPPFAYPHCTSHQLPTSFP